VRVEIFKVIQAWSVRGRFPAHHDDQKRLLKKRWPVLYEALEGLSDALWQGKLASNEHRWVLVIDDSDE
jgi:hypothetical protein